MAKVELAHRSCPSCGSNSRGSPLRSVPPGESLTFDALKILWNQVDRDRIFLPYWRCSECSFLYCPDFFSRAQLSELYSGMSDNTGGAPPGVIERTQDGYFDFLRRFSPLRGQYLEVGGDLGFFLKRAVQEGKFDAFWLFEPKERVQAELRRILAGRIGHLYPSMLTMDALPDRTLSVVVMVHVLDHFLEPKEMLTALRRKLTSDAVVLVVTHDERSALARVLGRRWGGYSLEHPYLFNPSTMARLMEQAGYRILTTEKTYNYFPLSFLIRQACGAFGLARPDLSSLDSVVVRLKLGNIITLAGPAA